MSRENVRISKDGWQLLNDRNLANKVSLAIGKSKDSLEKDGSLKIEGTDVTVELVTSLKDDQLTKRSR
jgi:hypothetical protein